MRNTRTWLSLATAAVAALAGCATDPLTAIGIPPLRPGPATVATTPGAGSVGAAAPAQKDVCRSQEFAAPVDVDTAYARAMSRFRFRTAEERKHVAERSSRGFIDEGFRHVAQPGAYYRMVDYGVVSEPGQMRQTAWLNMELTRDGPTRTRVKAGYCLWSGHPGAADADYQTRLEQTMRETVLK